MGDHPNVVVVAGRCARGRQGFGIRFEEQARGSWTADWAFALRDRSARREGYDRSEVRGSFAFGPAYPGCPHCHARSIFKCTCGGVACWDGERRSVTCPWCGTGIQLEGEVENLSGGRDR